MNYKDIRNRFRLIPFGKFSNSGRGKAPFNQIYVGRRKERAAFIEMLTHQQNFGSFLISGRRGSGKSSFVEYALEEYRQSSFHRFVRYARSNKWPDGIVALISGIILSILIVTIGQANELFSQNAFLSLDYNNKYLGMLTWVWVPLIILSSLSIGFFLFVWHSACAASALQETRFGVLLARIVSLSIIFILVGITLQGNFISKYIDEPPVFFSGLFKNLSSSLKYLTTLNIVNILFWLPYIIMLAAIVYIVFKKLNPPSKVIEKLKNFAIIITKFKILAGLTLSAALILLTITNHSYEGWAQLAGVSGGVIAAILAVTALYLADLLIQNIPISRLDESTSDDTRKTLRREFRYIVFFRFVFTFLFFVVFLDWFSFGAKDDHGGINGDIIYHHNWNIFFLLTLSAATAYIIKKVNEAYVDTSNESNKVPISSRIRVLLTPLFWFSVLAATIIVLVLSLDLLGLMPGDTELLGINFKNTAVLWSNNLKITLPFLMVLMSLEFRYGTRRNNPPNDPGTEFDPAKPRFYDSPPVKLVLHIKSYFLMLIGVVLAAPLINLTITLSGRANLPFFESAQAHMSRGEILTILFFLIAIFYAEYQWICRSLHAERQDDSITSLQRRMHQAKLHSLWPNLKNADANTNDFLNTGQATQVPLWTCRREIARDLERMTLPFHYYDARVPVLSTWINLGFDDLRHERIIEAMLVELKAKYRAKFLSLGSKIGLTNTIVMFLVMLILAKHIATALFHIGPILPIEISHNGPITMKIERQMEAGKEVPAELNYCKFFQINREVSPVSANFICLLPSSNALFEFLYSPILNLSVDFTAVDTKKITQRRIRIEDFGSKMSNKRILCGLRPSLDNLDKNFCTSTLSDSFLVNQVLDNNLGLPYIAVPPVEQEPEQQVRSQNTPTVYDVYHPTTPFGKKSVKFEEAGYPTVRVYHFLIFALIVLGMKLLNSIIQIFPYQARVTEMSRLIDLIRGKVTYARVDMPRVGWFQWLLGFNRREETIETNPDPRVIEQTFINLLQRMTLSAPSSGGSLSSRFETHPEVVFIFDEMDKLSGKVDAEISRSDEASTATEENARERQRSIQLQQLLLSMKRLLSSNSARFIFIGGRLYHDEWLADQANRTPLLTSIFNGQIYLPSLLTDREHAYGRFNDRIGEFLILIYRNAVQRFRYWRRLRYSPAFFGSGTLDRPTYAQHTLPFSGHPRRLAALAGAVGLRVYDERGEKYNFTGSPVVEGNQLGIGEQETLEQLLNFLTYRSAGNPKKMKEILQSLILPSSKAFSLSRYDKLEQYQARWNRAQGGNHHDVILLDDKTIYRIQFVDVLYRHLSYHLEGRMLERDDKVAMSLFYLMDFLLKFHNRGFSWTNLQRVDELSHIHRAPDLRSMMGELVSVSSERFLHRILNGVHSFRFRSDFAREIDYLSRISKEEMAALNFTLDESQNLKGLYQQTMNTGQRENIDTISGLGELYEYDQEYEIARNYYRHAMAVLDRGFSESTSSGIKATTNENSKTKRPRLNGTYINSQFTIHNQTEPDNIHEIEWLPSGFVQNSLDNPHAKKLIKSNFQWAIARLRLMLQIGHTYEQESNYERALSSYMYSHRFSQAIMDATIQSKKKTSPVKLLREDRSVLTENYSILYQAGLAAAWIFEKNGQDIDDSIEHSEHFVSSFYARYPILLSKKWSTLVDDEDPNKKIDKKYYRRNQSTVMLIVGDLHNRVGDLYFYKGKQATRYIKDFNAYRTEIDEHYTVSPRFGYLYQAHHHYALGIWNVRNYLALREKLSEKRLNILSESEDGTKNFKDFPTIHGDGLFPNLLYNNLTNSFTDMSEAILARASTGSLLRLFTDYEKPKGKLKVKKSSRIFRKHIGKKVATFTHHLPRTNAFDDEDLLKGFPLFHSENGYHLFGREIDAGKAHDWIGSPEDKWPESAGKFAENRTLKFTKVVNQDQRLNAYVFFSTTAAKIYGLGGYLIDSANEYILQADALISTLATISQLDWLMEHGSKNAKANVLNLIYPKWPTLHPYPSWSNEKWADKKFWNSAYEKWAEDNKYKKWTKNGKFKKWNEDNDLIGLLKNIKASSTLGDKTNDPALSDEDKEKEKEKIEREIIKKFEIEMRKKVKKSNKFRKKFRADNNATMDKFITAQCRLGVMAFTALKKAAELIQLSARPSATQTGQNHGNPAEMLGTGKRRLSKDLKKLINDMWVGSTSHKQKKMIKYYTAYDQICGVIDVCENIDSFAKKYSKLWRGTKLPEDPSQSQHYNDWSERYIKIRKLRISLHDIEDDYNLSQPWRDDPRILSLGAKLVLSLIRKRTDAKTPSQARTEMNKVAEMVYDEFLVVFGSDLFPVRTSSSWSDKDTRNTYSALYRLIERYRYPVLNRLNTLSTLIDAAIIHGEKIMERPKDKPYKKLSRKKRRKINQDHPAFVGRLCKELTATAGIYDSEMHFSPHIHGTSIAMAYFYCRAQGHHALYDNKTDDKNLNDKVEKFQQSHWSRKSPNKKNWEEVPNLSAALFTRDALGKSALNLLRRSEQMFSLGKGYYENIGRMQYLNDDFNDRVVHFNHAKRMFSAEMIHTLASSIHDDLYSR